MICRVINRTNRRVIVEKAKIARTFSHRLLGYLLRSKISDCEGLIFYDAPSIHTFFMRVAIDIVFVDENMKVAKIYNNCAPWRLASCASSFFVLELAAGKLATIPVRVGDELEVTLMSAS